MQLVLRDSYSFCCGFKENFDGAGAARPSQDSTTKQKVVTPAQATVKPSPVKKPPVKAVPVKATKAKNATAVKPGTPVKNAQGSKAAGTVNSAPVKVSPPAKSAVTVKSVSQINAVAAEVNATPKTALQSTPVTKVETAPLTKTDANVETNNASKVTPVKTTASVTSEKVTPAAKPTPEKNTKSTPEKVTPAAKPTPEKNTKSTPEKVTPATKLTSEKVTPATKLSPEKVTPVTKPTPEKVTPATKSTPEKVTPTTESSAEKVTPATNTSTENVTPDAETVGAKVTPTDKTSESSPTKTDLEVAAATSEDRLEEDKEAVNNVKGTEESKKPASEKEEPAPLRRITTEYSQAMAEELGQMMLNIAESLHEEAPTDADDLVVAEYKTQVADELRSVLELNLKQRMLNVHNTLIIKVTLDRPMPSKWLVPFVRKFNARKIRRMSEDKTSFVAEMRCFKDFDKLYAANRTKLGGVKVALSPIYHFAVVPDDLRHAEQEQVKSATFAGTSKSTLNAKRSRTKYEAKESDREDFKIDYSNEEDEFMDEMQTLDFASLMKEGIVVDDCIVVDECMGSDDDE